MSEFMTCFSCENLPTRQCPRCGRPYCDDHGEDVCDVCLEPASGLPSFTLFRGSLLALLIGTVLAVYLLVQPPGGESNPSQAGTVIEQTPTPATSTPDTLTTPILGSSPAAGETPAVEATPEPVSGGSTTYTVESGDTLFSICANIAPSLDADECVNEIVATNGLPDASDIIVGQELVVPQ
jgi:LysM repeat protein